MRWWSKLFESTEPLARVLAFVESHRVVKGPLEARVSVRYDELVAMEEDARLALLRPGIEAIRAVPDYREVCDAIGKLGRARFEPAVPLLAKLWAACPILPVRAAAGNALFAIDTPDAHDALESTEADSDQLSGFLAAKSRLHRDPAAAYAVTLANVESAKNGDVVAERAARETLALLCSWGTRGEERLYSLATGPKILRDDQRWIDLVAILRLDPAMSAAARAVLGELTAEERASAIERHPAPPRPAPHRGVHGVRDHFARWRSGEHGAWDELAAIGDIEGDLREEAHALAGAIMSRVASNADRVTERLREIGWPLDGGARRAPLLDLDDRIARLEHLTGGRVPVALEAFWKYVGAIDWAPRSGAQMERWVDLEIGHEVVDPLVLDDLEYAWVSVDEWLESVELDGGVEVTGPLILTVAPDHFLKLGISGGAPYAFELPDGGADPMLLHAPERLRLVAYLRHAFRWGGLPGVARSKRAGPTIASALAKLVADLEPF